MTIVNAILVSVFYCKMKYTDDKPILYTNVSSLGFVSVWMGLLSSQATRSIFKSSTRRAVDYLLSQRLSTVIQRNEVGFRAANTRQSSLHHFSHTGTKPINTCVRNHLYLRVISNSLLNVIANYFYLIQASYLLDLDAAVEITVTEELVANLVLGCVFIFVSTRLAQDWLVKLATVMSSVHLNKPLLTGVTTVADLTLHFSRENNNYLEIRI
jgi:hypothetical protein